MALLIHAPLLIHRRDNVSKDFGGSLHAAKDGGNVRVHRQQPRHWAASLGDYDFLASLLDLIEEMKTLCLELAGCDSSFHTMVILPWSLMAQRHCGIQYCRPARRQKTGCHRGQGDPGNHSDVCDGIGRGDAIEQSGEITREHQAPGDAG